MVIISCLAYCSNGLSSCSVLPKTWKPRKTKLAHLKLLLCSNNSLLTQTWNQRSYRFWLQLPLGPDLPLFLCSLATGHTVCLQCSGSVVSNSLQPHGRQHARPPCPQAAPEVHPNSCPLSQWCHPTSHPLSSPSPPAFNLSQHQGLFKWVSSSHQVAKVLEFQLQHQSFQWTPRTDFLQDALTGWISLLSPVFLAISLNGQCASDSGPL